MARWILSSRSGCKLESAVKGFCRIDTITRVNAAILRFLQIVTTTSDVSRWSCWHQNCGWPIWCRGIKNCPWFLAINAPWPPLVLEGELVTPDCREILPRQVIGTGFWFPLMLVGCRNINCCWLNFFNYLTSLTTFNLRKLNKKIKNVSKKKVFVCFLLLLHP